VFISPPISPEVDDAQHLTKTIVCCAFENKNLNLFVHHSIHLKKYLHSSENTGNVIRHITSKGHQARLATLNRITKHH